MDYLDAPSTVDGLYRYIFAVRDLASGNMLLALPSAEKEMKTACDALTALFKQHGAPLMIKSDCGFDAREVKTLMDEYRVTHLLSPPYFPRYNGAIEAGIGSLKTRAHYQSARARNSRRVDCDDVEAARLHANETPRPWSTAQLQGTGEKSRGRARSLDRTSIQFVKSSMKTKRIPD